MAMSITRRKFGIITAGIVAAVTDASNGVSAPYDEVEEEDPWRNQEYSARVMVTSQF
jgi:hypothetical protein